jgi:hypothetical protein
MSESKMNNEKRPMRINIIAAIAIIFGIATIKEGGTVLFTNEGRIAAGHYVPFVLWFNFIAGFAYIMAGIAILRLKTCSKRLSAVIAIATTIVFILFGVHIFNGGEYEMRTVIAMTIRSTLWISIAITAFRSKVLNPINCNC